MTSGAAPDAVQACAAGRGAASLTPSRGVRSETPGSSTHLQAKARGDTSRSAKPGTREGVDGVALRDPCDTVPATRPAPPSPAVQPHTHRDHASEAVPSRTRRAACATRTLRVLGEEERLHARGGVGHLRRARHVQPHRNAGGPPGRASQGHGVLVVVSGGESPRPGAGGQGDGRCKGAGCVRHKDLPRSGWRQLES